MPLLEVHELVKNYGRRRVVNGVTFDVDGGEVVGLLGPNGAGKTTSFRMTTGMISPYSGKVIFAGQDVTSWPMYKRARLGMGYLSQEKSVFRKLTVEQNILAILEAMPASRSLGRKLTARERWERTEKVLDEFGLNKVKKSQAQYLSGGECRRLEIARCLVCEPLLILLDEPFTGIDPITIGEIQNIVRRLRDQGIGLLLTDHNVREALKITDRSYVIADGQVEAHGSPAEIVQNPVVIKKYLGESFAQDALGAVYPSPSIGEGRGGAVLPITEHGRPNPTTVQSLLEQERLLDLVEQLKTDQRHAAEKELLKIGRPAIPLLLQVLERPDVEMRRMGFHVLQRILDGQGHFDPYAPKDQRRQQIERLRAQVMRRAG